MGIKSSSLSLALLAVLILSITPLASSQCGSNWIGDTSGDTDFYVSRNQNLGTGLASHERIRAFAILPAPLSLERGEMTPTLKLRRDRIAVTYSQLIEELYCQPTLQDVPGIGVSCTAS